ncbi:MAG: hypothetical protein ILO68_01335, partial [Clostridia bacterium]|nr:hypothetical protein [Clostridia bacterium]
QKYCQQIAVEDTGAVGATYEAMRRRSMVFVLMRLSVDFPVPVRANEEVLLRTHAYKCDGVMFYRAFELYRDGVLAAVADTRGVLIDYVKRTILRPSQYTFPLQETQPEAELPPIDRRIVLTGADLKVLRSVRYTEMDENGHLNNCVYSDWAMDDAPADYSRYRVRSLCVHFDHEARWKDELELTYQKDGSGCLLTAFNRTSGQTCFSAVLRMEEKRDSSSGI